MVDLVAMLCLQGMLFVFICVTCLLSLISHFMKLKDEMTSARTYV